MKRTLTMESLVTLRFFLRFKGQTGTAPFLSFISLKGILFGKKSDSEASKDSINNSGSSTPHNSAYDTPISSNTPNPESGSTNRNISPTASEVNFETKSENGGNSADNSFLSLASANSTDYNENKSILEKRPPKTSQPSHTPELENRVSPGLNSSFSTSPRPTASASSPHSCNTPTPRSKLHVLGYSTPIPNSPVTPMNSSSNSFLIPRSQMTTASQYVSQDTKQEFVSPPKSHRSITDYVLSPRRDPPTPPPRQTSITPRSAYYSSYQESPSSLHSDSSPSPRSPSSKALASPSVSPRGSIYH